MPNSSLRWNITQGRSRGYLRAYISLVSRGGLDFQDVDAQQTGDELTEFSYINVKRNLNSSCSTSMGRFSLKRSIS